MATKAEVEAALSEVADPEYPVSLVDMGLIRGVELNGSAVKVSISYCSLGCPCLELIEQNVEARLLDVAGIDHVEVVESFDPWTRKDISHKGLALLRRTGVG